MHALWACTWDYWWEFNQASYLRPRGAPRLSAQLVRDEVLPALMRAIDATNQRDVVSACLIALAKISVSHPEMVPSDVFAARLANTPQDVRETAALALGITGSSNLAEQAALTLALDEPAGRRLCADEVDIRTRSFATYGLALAARRTSVPAVKRRGFEHMCAVLDVAAGNNQLTVAAISGLGVLRITPTTDANGELLAEVLATLEACYRQVPATGDHRARAQVPTAIARLLTRDHPEAERYKAMFAEELFPRGGDPHCARSCALALGALVRPHQGPDAANLDNRYSEALLSAADRHPDAQTRYFATIALGLIGGERNRDALLRRFGATAGFDKQWCALALGVCSHHLQRDAATAPDRHDPRIGSALFAELKVARDYQLVAALGVALGLDRSTAAAA